MSGGRRAPSRQAAGQRESPGRPGWDVGEAEQVAKLKFLGGTLVTGKQLDVEIDPFGRPTSQNRHDREPGSSLDLSFQLAQTTDLE